MLDARPHISGSQIAFVSLSPPAWPCLSPLRLGDPEARVSAWPAASQLLPPGSVPCNCPSLLSLWRHLLSPAHALLEASPPPGLPQVPSWRVDHPPRRETTPLDGSLQASLGTHPFDLPRENPDHEDVYTPEKSLRCGLEMIKIHTTFQNHGNTRGRNAAN